MDLSILIVSWNTRELLRNCLGSLAAAADGLAYETIVVDNGSTDGSPGMVRQEFPNVRLVENGENLGFVRASNQAIALSQGRYILLLNSDTVTPPRSLASMVEFMEGRRDAGAAGPKLVNPDGSFQASYARFPTWFSEGLCATGLNRRLYGPSHPSPPPRAGETRRPVDWVPGTCMLVRREVIDQIGTLDEAFWMYSEDTDLCYRTHQAGWRVYYLPDVEVLHFGAASSRQRRPESIGCLYQSKVRFLRKHHGFLSALLSSTVIAAVYGVKAGIAALTLLLPSRRVAARAEFRTARRVWEGCLEVLTGHDQRGIGPRQTAKLPFA